MKTIESLTIKVTYEVGLGQVEMPKEIAEQLKSCFDSGDEIGWRNDEYQEAQEWIVNNIKERDCCDYKAEVIEITE